MSDVAAHSPTLQSVPTRRKSVARRVLASFVITLAAFIVTVGWAVYSERRAVLEATELSRGYVPLALKLAKLRATQATIATLVDGVPDERDPASLRILLDMLVVARRSTWEDLVRTAETGLPGDGGARSASVRTHLLAELAAFGDTVAKDRPLLDRLFGQGGGRADGTLLLVGSIEHDAERRLRDLSTFLGTAMDEYSANARERQMRSIVLLVGLFLLTLLVAILLTLHVRSVLLPLGTMAERARAVASGDFVPRAVVASDNEIGELAVTFESMVGALARARDQALANERLAAIGKMAAHVTHEIRNPLSSIGLNLELLDEELTSEQAEARTLLAAITREVARLERLSEEYLRMARLPVAEMQRQCLSDVIQEVADLSRRELQQAGVTLETRIAPDLWTRFDDAQIRQATWNLLRNAREAMAAGGAVSLELAPREDMLSILVEDRGTGIAPEVRARIFEPLFSTKGSGTGLGLAVVHQIVQAHGGRIECNPRDGGGTSFRLDLPAHPDEERELGG